MGSYKNTCKAGDEMYILQGNPGGMDGSKVIALNTENGKLKEYETFKDDEPDGIYKEWDDEGRLYEEKNYKAGELDGPRKTWYKNGKLKAVEYYKAGYCI